MPSWRPSTATDPDAGDAWRFRPLAETDPECAERLIDRFARVWLEVAALPMTRLAEVPDTLELVVADSWDPADGTQVLRLTSWYTGETRWLPEWDGRFETAVSWIESTADEYGSWVQTERTDYGTQTTWDE